MHLDATLNPIRRPNEDGVKNNSTLLAPARRQGAAHGVEDLLPLAPNSAVALKSRASRRATALVVRVARARGSRGAIGGCAAVKSVVVVVGEVGLLVAVAVPVPEGRAVEGGRARRVKVAILGMGRMW